MEFFKEIKILGKNFLKAKKGFRLSKEEIEESKKIIANTIKGVNMAADFINENKLSEPITDNSLIVYKKILWISILFFSLSILSIVFINNIFSDLIIIMIFILFGRLLLIISLIFIFIFSFLLYAKIKEINKK